MDPQCITSRFGQYTAEYDRADGSLRLSWYGWQTALDQEEAQGLFNFLNSVLPGSPEKPEFDFSYLEGNGTGQAWNL